MKKNAGKIYLEIARRALEEWYPRMTKEEREDLLYHADCDKLEPYIGAKDSIEATLRGLDDGIRELWGIHLPDFKNTVDYVLHGAQPADPLLEIISILSGVSKTQARFIVSCALHEVHDQWVRDNTEKFFDVKRVEQRYMFTRTALIGWKTVEKDLLFVEPILKGLSLNMDDLDLERCYHGYAREFREAFGITPENLVSFIAKGSEFYSVLDESISEFLKKDPVTCRSMTLQINKANL